MSLLRATPLAPSQMVSMGGWTSTLADGWQAGGTIVACGGAETRQNPINFLWAIFSVQVTVFRHLYTTKNTSFKKIIANRQNA
jgi:hypothetical protein